METKHKERTYDPGAAVVFRLVRERYGGLSNFGRFPMAINGVSFATSEGVYQACRFPHHPDVQLEIARCDDPMGTKRLAHSHIRNTRPDWQSVNIRIMRWVIRAKLACNWESFGALLDSTMDIPIVEYSRRDTFWGANLVDGRLVGVNALGRLLMELRDEFRGQAHDSLRTVAPPHVPDFLLAGEPVGSVGGWG